MSIYERPTKCRIYWHCAAPNNSIIEHRRFKEETQKVRLAAKALLHRLHDEIPRVLVQDWFKDAQSKIRVRSAVETVLDANLPKSYDRAVFTEKCNGVFDLMLNYASQGLKWAA